MNMKDHPPQQNRRRGKKSAGDDGRRRTRRKQMEEIVAVGAVKAVRDMEGSGSLSFLRGEKMETSYER